MLLTINGAIEKFDEPHLSVEELLAKKNIPSGGTAVALNGALVIRGKWSDTRVVDGDKITIISAAYGG